MKTIAFCFFVILYIPEPVFGQEAINRQVEIEKLLKQVYTVQEFIHIADSLQLSIDELSDYPVIFPVRKQLRVSSGLGLRIHPVSKVLHFHTGIDIPKSEGTPVYATANGVVIGKGYNSGYGNYIEVQHAGGFSSFYAHLSHVLVNVGDTVYVAEQIANVGNTGVSTGSHLHYEIRKGEYVLNPIGWCQSLLILLNRTGEPNNKLKYEF